MPLECDCAFGKSEIASKAASLLVRLSGELELLGEALCQDEAFVGRHIAILQGIDVIAQQQRALSELLTCEDPDTAIAEAGLQIFQMHFQRAS